MGLRDKISRKRDAIKEKSASRTREYTFKPGKTKFRLLPGVGNADDFYQEMGMHWIKDENGKVVTVVGDREICYGEPCPVRSAIDQLIRLGESTGNDKLMERGKDMKASPRFKANIEIVDAPGEFEANKPVLADFPQTVFDTLLAQLEELLEDLPEDLDVTKEGPLSFAKGVVFVLEKTGSGLDTRYTVYSSGKGKKTDPAIMQEAVDLLAYKRGQFDESVRKALAYLGDELGVDLSGKAGGLAAPKEAARLEGPKTSGSFEDEDEEEGEVEDAEVVEDEDEAPAEDADVEVEVDEDDIMAQLEDL